jgi:hypothetical protein
MLKLHPVCALIVVMITILYLAVYGRSLYNEGFESFYYPKYCKDCNRVGRKGEQACMACQNCGWCVDPNGYGSCVLGDNTGPYFADCKQYYYSGGVGVVNSPVGPANPPFYQYFVPWYGGQFNPSQFSNVSLRQLGPYTRVNQYGRPRNMRRWRKRGNRRYVRMPNN